jgi:drug/metabolite transporter (DMT)-like permease
MDLALVALLAALFSALCQSVTDLGTKAATRVGDDRAILAAQWGAGALLLLIVCLVAYPGLATAPIATLDALTRPGFVALLATSSALNITAYALYIRALRLSDASLVAPLALLTPVLMLATSPVMTGERAPPMGAFGVLFTVLGVGLLDARRGPGGRINFAIFVKDPGARAMLATAAIWSVTANIDKLGVKASTPLIWIAALIHVIALCAAVWWAMGRRPAPRLSQLRPALLAGAAMAIGTSAQMWALTILFTPYVIAIKRLSALFTVLASGRVLKEETGGRLPGASIMLLGAVMIALARG